LETLPAAQRQARLPTVCGLTVRPEALERAAAPVQQLPGDRLDAQPTDGVALCLSGGGYRAMLFHAGALWRLSDLGYLPRLDRISSVSGGSLSAGFLAEAWNRLGFDESGLPRGFSDTFVRPLRALAGTTIDVSAGLRGLLGPGSIGNAVARAYARHGLGTSTLQDLPDRPRFVFNATNLQSGVLWRFSKPFMRDYRVGEVKTPSVAIAVAVAASSVFPPFLSPLVLELRESDYSPPQGEDLHFPPFTTRPTLADGGIYDNLGLETAWKRHRTVLVSDGGGRFSRKERPPRVWPQQLIHVTKVIDSQVRSLRKRQVIDGYEAGLREGAYWGIWTDIANYPVEGALPCPPDKTVALARISTRLAKLDATRQERLINWGYAVCDATMRAHVDRSLPAPSGFPYSAAGVG
jgi:NTE family protein